MIFKPIGNFASAFWTTLIGPKPVVPDPIQMMNEVARKAAEEAVKATAEAVAKVAEEATKKAAEEAAKAAEEVTQCPKDIAKASKDQCTHCKGTGISQKKGDQNCPHCKGKGRKPVQKTVQKPVQKPVRKDEKIQGYQGKSEFFIEGYDKMTTEQKRAAKQAKWDESQASKAPKTMPVINISTSWGDQVFDERQGAAI